MRRQLREPLTEDQMAALYPQPHDHTRWKDHLIRVDTMIAIGRHFGHDGMTVVDLSTGDGAIPRGIAEPYGGTRVILGDYASGYDICGPIEKTAKGIAVGTADIWVCSETLEHVADPEGLLLLLRPRSRWLIISTPDGELDDSNPEHIWAWDSQSVGEMLWDTNWVPKVHTRLDLRPAGFLYCYQIWVCR